MLVAGLYNGNVAVYNLQKNTSKPAFISTAINGKHKELVWQVLVYLLYLVFVPSLQVKWAPDNDEGYLNFHSVAADGRVSNWTLVKV